MQCSGEDPIHHPKVSNVDDVNAIDESSELFGDRSVNSSARSTNANLEPNSDTSQLSGSTFVDQHEIRKDECHDSKL